MIDDYFRSSGTPGSPPRGRSPVDAAELVERLRDDIMSWPEVYASRQSGPPERASLDVVFQDDRAFTLTVHCPQPQAEGPQEPPPRGSSPADAAELGERLRDNIQSWPDDIRSRHGVWASRQSGTPERASLDVVFGDDRAFTIEVHCPQPQAEGQQAPGGALRPQAADDPTSDRAGSRDRPRWSTAVLVFLLAGTVMFGGLTAVLIVVDMVLPVSRLTVVLVLWTAVPVAFVFVTHRRVAGAQRAGRSAMQYARQEIDEDRARREAHRPQPQAEGARATGPGPEPERRSRLSARTDRATSGRADSEQAFDGGEHPPDRSLTPPAPGRCPLCAGLVDTGSTGLDLCRRCGRFSWRGRPLR